MEIEKALKKNYNCCYCERPKGAKQSIKARLLRHFVPRNDTIFEKKVYRVVSKIPKGQVRSYKWVAEKIGSPKASRAVGNALNKNPYIGIVPCHRVIRSDGSIGGFALGVKKKREFLESERNT